MGNPLFGVDISGIIAKEVGGGVLDATLGAITPGTRTTTNLTGGTSTVWTTTEGRSIDVSNFEIRLLDANIVAVSGPPNPSPSSTQTTFASLSGTDLKIISSTGAASRRAWDITPDLQLAIAADAYTGSYSATMTITIANGP